MPQKISIRHKNAQKISIRHKNVQKISIRHKIAKMISIRHRWTLVLHPSLYKNYLFNRSQAL